MSVQAFEIPDRAGCSSEDGSIGAGRHGSHNSGRSHLRTRVGSIDLDPAACSFLTRSGPNDAAQPLGEKVEIGKCESVRTGVNKRGMAR
jgi:hypothetical protein